MGGLGGGAKGKRSYPPGGGALMRPSSVGDFNEVDEDSWSINQMPDHEVDAEFEKMLENMKNHVSELTLDLMLKQDLCVEDCVTTT